MTDRERWVNTMHFKSVDRVPHEEFGYWKETLERWHKEGLSVSVDDDEKADRFFGFDRREGFGPNIGLFPEPFWNCVLEENEKYKIVVDGVGAKSQIFTDGSSSIPRYLDYTLKDRNSWEKHFKKYLNPSNIGRYPENWEELKKKHENRDYPLGISVGSLYGWLRGWIGVENFSVMFYEEPMLVHDMMESLTDLTVTVIEKALKEVQYDFASFWEDMAYNKGPLISPAMFKEFMVPGYKRITSLLRKYGVDVVIVDCDGNINELVHLWLEAGVNCMFPLEVACDTDPVKLREKYGKDVLLLGGVNKVALIKGKKTIDEEIKRLEKLVKLGGFIPHVDHRVPPDVSYENYLYYLDIKKRMFGIK